MKKNILLIGLIALLTGNWCFAQDTESNISSTLTDSVLVISGTGDMPSYYQWSTRPNKSPWEGLPDIKKIIIEDGITSIGNNTFPSLPNLVAVEFPQSLTTLGSSAFEGCTKLTSINSLFDIESFGYNVFSGCENLQLPPINFFYVTHIGDYAFKNCKGLQSISLYSKNMHNIGYRAFEDSDLSEVLLPDDESFFLRLSLFHGCKMLTSIAIPEVVTGIESSAFENSGLRTIDIPGSILWIGDRAFAESDLESIRFPANYKGTVISSGTFQGTKLKNITIPEGINTIWSSAFADCPELTSVTLPTSIENIFPEVFRNCTKLTTIAIPSKHISDAFATGSGLISIDILSMVEHLHGKQFEGCNSLKSINVDDANPSYSSVEGIAFNKNKTMIICYPGGKTESHYTIPSSVKTIGTQAFFGIDSLKTVTIPESVTAIQPKAFLIKGLTVETENRIPQLIEVEAFGSNSIISTNTLIVPDGTSALYKSAKVWRDFGSIIEKSEVANEFFGSDIRLTAYPNPVGDILYLNCDESLIGQSCRIFNMNGALFTDYTITETKTVIDVSGYPAGIYILKVGDRNNTAKFVKAN